MAELVEVASKATSDAKRKRVFPVDVLRTARFDPELGALFQKRVLYTADKLSNIVKSIRLPSAE